MSKFKLGDEVWDTKKRRGGKITHLYLNISESLSAIIQLPSGASWAAMERHLRLSKETVKKEERMMKDFKVGDKVTNDGSDNVGEILFLYIDGLIDAALVQWPNTVNSWPVSRLTKYQEPLKYGSGEEAKVGDLIIQRGFVHPQTAQVLRIEPNTIYVKQYGKYNNTVDWGNFHNMELLLRLGELYEKN